MLYVYYYMCIYSIYTIHILYYYIYIPTIYITLTLTGRISLENYC